MYVESLFQGRSFQNYCFVSQYRIVTPQMDISTQQTESLSVYLSNVEDMCACVSTLEDGQTVLIVVYTFLQINHCTYCFFVKLTNLFD